MHGNEKLGPEKITTYEFGYQTRLFDKVDVSIESFHNFVEGLIASAPVEYEEVTLPYPPFTPLFSVPTEITFVNTGKAQSMGGEISVSFPVTDWLAFNANYAYQDVIRDETEERIKSAPRNKFNANLRLTPLRGLSCSLSLHYVDATEWEVKDSEGRVSREKAEAYTLLNARLGYKFLDDRLEVAAAVFNLLHDKHREYPLGEELGTRFTLGLSYVF